MNKYELVYDLKEHLDTYSQTYDDYIMSYGEVDMIYHYIEEKDKEIERLNNNINKGIEAINVYQNEKTLSIRYQDLNRIRGILRGNEFDLKIFEKYLKELKGSDKE